MNDTLCRIAFIGYHLSVCLAKHEKSCSYVLVVGQEVVFSCHRCLHVIVNIQEHLSLLLMNFSFFSFSPFGNHYNHQAFSSFLRPAL